jgi:hypothetical protein
VDGHGLPLEVLVEETARAYLDFHEGWGRRVAEQARELAAVRPDGVLANVPYLILAAAERSGIPAVALCSLNWADIYAHYCGSRPEAQTLRQQMLEAYCSAVLFLKPEPAMPMPDIPGPGRS